AYAYLGDRPSALKFFHQAAERAQENLKVNIRNSSLRALLAYCLAQTGDPARAKFEVEQALQSSPQEKAVRKYAVLTYEVMSQREKALETLRGAPKQVVDELESGWVTEQLRQDPRYHDIVRQIKNR